MKFVNKYYYRVQAETIFYKRKTLVEGITDTITVEAPVMRQEEWPK